MESSIEASPNAAERAPGRRNIFSPAVAGDAPDGAIDLICLPHAGAGASAYRDWQARLGPGIAVSGVCPPGRDGRFREPLGRSVEAVLADLIDPVAARIRGRFAIFGHSMGALLGYELAHRLTAIGRAPAHLFVSGYRAPHLALASRNVHLLPDERLVRHLVALEGMAPQVVGRPDLVELLLPILRADYELCETYRHRDREPIGVPITAMCGNRDPGVGRDHVIAWGELTSAAFDAELFDGGHFYLEQSFSGVAEVLRSRLAVSAVGP